MFIKLKGKKGSSYITSSPPLSFPPTENRLLRFLFYLSIYAIYYFPYLSWGEGGFQSGETCLWDAE